MKKYKFPYFKFFLTLMPYIFMYSATIFSVNYYFKSLLDIRDKGVDPSNLEVKYNPTLDLSDFLYIDNKATDCIYEYCPEIQQSRIFVILKDISFSMVGTYDNREFLFFDDLFLTNPKFYNIILFLFLLSYISRKTHKYQYFYYEYENNSKQNTD